jgi:regulator of CtrA degradation
MTGTRAAGDKVTISFGAKFAQSEQFRAVFREGMALVEETANYLDGEGRKEARKLPPPYSLAYASESMQLTTRLMQLASWLLIRRAVSEGELTPEQGLEEQRKIKFNLKDGRRKGREFDALPERLKDLVEQSLRLQERVIKLDQMLVLDQSPGTEAATGANPLKTQLSRLHAAFGPRKDERTA